VRFAIFLLRFLIYAIVLGATYAIAQALWASHDLEAYSDLNGVHALGVTVLMVAPIALAVIAIVARPLAIFVLFYLVGAVLTAPFALARFAG
jgi:hypothetical protein